MTTQDFNKIAEKMLSEAKSTLVRKTSEYNLDEDRLSVFKRAAQLQKCTPEQALLGMVSKQIISVYDIIENKQSVSNDVAHEKLGDIINYMILLYALMNDKEA